MADISDRPRVFKVWLDRNVPGVRTDYEQVEVPAGEDADVICADVLDGMIGNVLDTGWNEVEP